jgi:hypothetical protein
MQPQWMAQAESEANVLRTSGVRKLPDYAVTVTWGIDSRLSFGEALLAPSPSYNVRGAPCE